LLENIIICVRITIFGQLIESKGGVASSAEFDGIESGSYGFGVVIF